ncbi:hypothetical protein BJ742DRAFT_816685 [Cladochytrium replicatum]|nr:hypothetical protein BJ742DRAFT_816685 [Cladochytrium replicatum]
MSAQMIANAVAAIQQSAHNAAVPQQQQQPANPTRTSMASGTFRRVSTTVDIADERTRLNSDVQNAVINAGLRLPLVRFYYRIPAFTTKVVRKWVEVEVVPDGTILPPQPQRTRGVLSPAQPTQATTPAIGPASERSRPQRRQRRRIPTPTPTLIPSLLAGRITTRYYTERTQKLENTLPVITWGPGLIQIVGYTIFITATCFALVMLTGPAVGSERNDGGGTTFTVWTQLLALLQSPSFYLLIMIVLDVISLSTIWRHTGRITVFEKEIEDLVEQFNALDTHRFAVGWTMRRSWSEDADEVEAWERYFAANRYKRFSGLWLRSRDYVVEAKLQLASPTSLDDDTGAPTTRRVLGTRDAFGISNANSDLPIYEPYAYDEVLKESPPAELRIPPPVYTQPAPPPNPRRYYARGASEEIELRSVISQRASTSRVSTPRSPRSPRSVAVVVLNDPEPSFLASLSSSSSPPPSPFVSRGPTRRLSSASASSMDALDPDRRVPGAEEVDITDLQQAGPSQSGR